MTSVTGKEAGELCSQCVLSSAFWSSGFCHQMHFWPVKYSLIYLQCLCVAAQKLSATLDVIPNPLCTAESFFFHRESGQSLLMIYLAYAAINTGYSCAGHDRDVPCAPKALPTLGTAAVGDSPSSLQHLQVQAGDKALGVPVPTLRSDAHYPVAACCLLSS